jgi:hypothetical protein
MDFYGHLLVLKSEFFQFIKFKAASLQPCTVFCTWKEEYSSLQAEVVLLELHINFPLWSYKLL